jgi:hypothetical protein
MSASTIKIPRTGDKRTDQALRSVVKQLEKNQTVQNTAIVAVASSGGSGGSSGTGGDSFLEWVGL